MQNNCQICKASAKDLKAQCLQCKSLTCESCILTYNLKHKYNIFECVRCCLLGLNPTVAVTEVLSNFILAKPGGRNKDKIALPINNPDKLIADYQTSKSENGTGKAKNGINPALREIFTNTDSTSIGIDDDSLGNPRERVEIRCIKLDHRGKFIIGEQTWPDYFELHFNKKPTLLTCMPIEYNTSIKKRKDEIYSLSIGKFICMIKESKTLNDMNGFWINYSNTLDNKNSFNKDTSIISYMFVVVKVVGLDYDDFEKSSLVRMLTQNQSLNYIKALFNSSCFSNSQIQASDIMDIIEAGSKIQNIAKVEEEIEVEGLKLDTVCNLSYTKLDKPGRGNKCYHVSCFSLKNMFETIRSSKHKKIYCPICGNAIQYFYYDKLIESIIKTSGDDVDCIDFNNIGEIQAILNNKSGGDDNQKVKGTDIIEVDMNSNSNSIGIEEVDKHRSAEVLFFENLWKNRDQLQNFREDIIQYIINNSCGNRRPGLRLNIPEL